ncbi:MAG: PQQ-dependent sugar dehydrogenase [Hyphomicrobium sp.]|nr:PQQ-dependent sugar dehydrogenase [Hyphomicrobium sp.]
MSRRRNMILVATVIAFTAGPASAAQTDAPKPAKESRVKAETVAKGLASPWGLQFLPDGRMLVTEKPGRLRIVTRDGKVGAAISGVPKVFATGQGGLLDVLLATDFGPRGGDIYLSFSEPREDGAAATAVARARLTLDDTGGGTLSGLETIFQQQPAVAKSGNHFGSRLVWAPDRSLFVTTGDRGSARSEVQKPDTTIGKVLNLKPDGSPAHSQPAQPGWDPKIWSLGHRNIQGAALDPATGELWTVEHGARGGDELNLTKRGKNYGWPIITYSNEYFGGAIGEGTSRPGIEQPVYYWVPSIATSGLAIYSGDLFPEWKGNIFVGGLKGAQLSRLVLKNGEVVAEETLLRDLDQRIRDVRQGPDGALWLLTDDPRDGQIVRLSPAS